MLRIGGDASRQDLREYLAIVLPADVQYAWVSETGYAPYKTYDVLGWATEAESQNDDGRKAICRFNVVDLGDDGHSNDPGFMGEFSRVSRFATYENKVGLDPFTAALLNSVQE